MSQTHFDAVILGDSLASRVAGALVARAGCRLLTLHDDTGLPPSLWPCSSLLLDRVLERLEGRTVLTRPLHFQYVKKDIRLDINGSSSFAEELRRELGSAAVPVAAFLDELGNIGGKLAGLLWDHGGLPLQGPLQRLRHAARGWRRQGLGNGRLNRTLARRLAALGPDTAAVADGLLAALCQAPSDRLTLAEAALAWHSVRCSSGFSAAGLDDLLRHRYRQFHGEEERLDTLQALETSRGRPIRLQLGGSRYLTAEHLILGEADAGRRFGLPPGSTSSAPRQSVDLSVGDTASPVLAEHVLLGGAPPLRLTFAGPPAGRILTVEWFGSPEAAEIEGRLKGLLPFAPVDFRLPAESTAAGPPYGLPNAARLLRPSRRIFACEATALPAIGAVGEVLTGISVATTLLAKQGHSPFAPPFGRKK